MSQHERFLARLEASRPAVEAVAMWLLREGRTVYMPPIRSAPTAAEAQKLVDDGDLIVDGYKRIEVKEIKHNFTSGRDWPFRELLISNEATVLRAEGKVSAYITISRDLSHIAIVVPAESRHRWYVTEKLAGNTMNVERFFACSLRSVSFKSIATRS